MMATDSITHDCSQVRGDDCWRQIDSFTADNGRSRLYGLPSTCQSDPPPSFFDSRYQTMQAGNEAEGLRSLCYDQQAALVESLIEPGMTVLDVGCGPRLPYDTRHAYVIGLDPSQASLAVNTDVDERIVGTATAIPLPDDSVDLVVAFYAVHHMTGQNTNENCWQRHVALQEMRRVVKPGGELLVFEMTPHPWAATIQSRFWDFAKWALGSRLDSFFWPAADLYWDIPQTTPIVRTFSAPWWATFPPIFAAPWLRIPRFLYPFDAVLYRWRV